MSPTTPPCIVKDMNFFANKDYRNHPPTLHKYRNRFDEAELCYLYWDVELINLNYKKNNENLTLQCRCKALSSGKTVVSADRDVQLFPHESIVTVNHGWGNPQPGFWKADQYLWEVLINDHVAFSKTIIVDKLGLVTTTDNPYFSVRDTRLFAATGNAGEWIKPHRYLTQFNAAKTEMVGIELTFERKFAESKTLEFVVTVLDPATARVFFYSRSEQHCASAALPASGTACFRHGGAKGTYWTKGNYQFYISFMDVTVSSGQFTVGDEEIAGMVLPLNKAALKVHASSDKQHEQHVEEALAELDALVGMVSVKKAIRENIDYLKFNKLRMDKGFADDSQLGLHSIFTGNPGTGKTTVVRLLGKIYKAMGLLSKGHVVEAGRADIIGEFIGQTAPKTKALIEKARGGILFIDEVYTLIRKESVNDFGPEAVEIIMKEMSDGPGDIAIIGAGYPAETLDFINSNPGLKSRFSQRFHFDDYMPDELMEIANLALQKEEATLSSEAAQELREVLSDLYRSRDRSFGNARMVYGIIDQAKKHMGIRLLQQSGAENLSLETMSLIALQDLQKVFETENKKRLHINIDDYELNEALTELNTMVGLQQLKQEVNNKISLVRYYLESGRDVLNRFSLHAVLTGNPGTGKTTLARILGRIYKALGLLERGHVVEVDRQNLVAGYVGQTAIKTAEAINSAMGGVLFIDEAYALVGGKGSKHDFGSEAIETLLKMMEDNRGKFAVIAAGYPDNMEEFVHSNPGLQSRFDVTYHLPDYSFEELYEIAQRLLTQNDLALDDEAAQHLSTYLQKAYQERDKFFGNARFVRQTVEAIVTRQHLRMASIPREQRTPQLMEQVVLSDVQQLPVRESGRRQRIGFKL